MSKLFNVMIAGVGGQGNVLASHIVGDAAMESGYRVTVSENYGGAMRGGAVYSIIKIGEGSFSPLLYDDSVDVLIGIEPLEAIRQGVQYLAPHGISIVNTRPIPPVDVNQIGLKYPPIKDIISSLEALCKKVYHFNALELSKEAGNILTVNNVMIGALAETGALPLSADLLKKSMIKLIPKRTEEVNIKAFELGRKAIREFED